MAGTDEYGHQRLLFSIRQIEYLQYYIHVLKLTDPKVAKKIANVEVGPDAVEEDYGDEVVDDWVPMPSHVFRPDAFVRIVSSPST